MVVLPNKKFLVVRTFFFYFINCIFIYNREK
nr:MAG TPA: hypothetical protein [Caudoviricetes sp.]